MKSSAIAPAVLGAALFSQAAIAASIGHTHGQGHVHRRAPIEAVVDTSSLTESLKSLLAAKTILQGFNYQCNAAATHPVTLGNDTNSPWVVQFNNKSPKNMTLIVWTDSVVAPGSGSFIGVHQPDITYELAVNHSVWVSFDPSKNNNAIHGGFGALDPDCGLGPSGQLEETWGELGFVLNDPWGSSTTDVSRLVSMAGRNLTIENYANAEDALNPGIKPACVAHNEKCAYVCPGAETTCYEEYSLMNCPYGAPNTTSSQDMRSGGCGGMSKTGGYVNVNFE